MADENLKQFAAKINSHFPRGSDDRYRFKHLDIDPNALVTEAPAAPAPRTAPPPAVESVQGAFSFSLTDELENEMRDKDKEMDKMVRKTVPEMLMEAAEVYKQRQAIYGYNYLQFGHVMMALFPNGINIEDIDTWNRLGIFVQMITKVTRYASQFAEGGHDDSLLDLSVYSQMLREVDAMVKEK